MQFNAVMKQQVMMTHSTDTDVQLPDDDVLLVNVQLPDDEVLFVIAQTRGCKYRFSVQYNSNIGRNNIMFKAINLYPLAKKH